jgi:NAD(P)-dependent dehydrogenase (short-subunit alcohol dehydrogenase family)
MSSHATSLDGRVALISGAGRARGIGKATAQILIAHGARVVLLDLDEAEAQATALEVAGSGGQALGLACDVRKLQDCERAVQRAVEWAGGGLDILINNAGVTQRRPLPDISADDYDLVTDVVLRGTLNLSQAALPHLNPGASIVCVSSMSAQQGGGVFGGAHYCAAKAGVLGLVRAMARELGPRNIRVNAVAPGLILTDFSRSGSTDEDKHAIARNWPLARAGSPSEVAGAILFLASDLSSYVTGTTLDVNGGAHMR